MGLFLTIVFIVLSYLSPADLFPELARFRILVWIGALAMIVSLPNIPLQKIRIFGKPTLFLVGLMVAIPLSRAANRWFGGAVASVYEFGISAGVFFIVLCNAYSIRRARRLVTVLILCCLYMVAQGIAAIFFDYRSDVLVYVHNTIPTHEKPYVETIERIRATGWLNDPNDLAQQFAVVMPFLGLAWKRRSAMWNTLVVILPGLALLYGMYLTRSRGGLMGIAAVCFFALRDRVRPLTAAVMTFGTVLVLLGLSFGGGRSISTSENSAGSRLILWGDGFSMFKSHPLFGVGFGSFTEYTGQTAHNSFVLAFSELGLFGYFFWLGILVFCFAQLNQVIREASSDKPSDIEIQRWAKVLRISFATFLVTGWFLSRTYIPTLYILAALSTSLYELWRRNNPEMVYKEASLTGRRILLTGVLEVTSMIAVYVMIRSRGL